MNSNRMLFAAMAAIGAIAMSGSALAQNNSGNSGTMTMVTTGNRLSVEDQLFLMDVIHANAREIELSRVAYRNAGYKGLSDFAHHMIRDHEDLQKQLLGTYGNMTFAHNWPDTVGKNQTWAMNEDGTANDHDWSNWNYLYQSDWNEINHLRHLNGRALDTQYIHDMVTDHAMLINEINMRKGMTQDTDIQSLISTIAPTVENHLQDARGISFSYDDPFGMDRDNTLSH